MFYLMEGNVLFNVLFNGRKEMFYLMEGRKCFI